MIALWGIGLFVAFLALPLRLALEFDPAEAKRFESVLEAIGAIAASRGEQLHVRAPSELEIALPKPLLVDNRRSRSRLM